MCLWVDSNQQLFLEKRNLYRSLRSPLWAGNNYHVGTDNFPKKLLSHSPDTSSPFAFIKLKAPPNSTKIAYILAWKRKKPSNNNNKNMCGGLQNGGICRVFFSRFIDDYKTRLQAL